MTEEEKKELELQEGARQSGAMLGFTNIGRWQQANQTQGAEMAGQLVGQAEQLGSEATRTVNAAKNRFDTQSQAGAVGAPPATYDFAKGAYGAGKQQGSYTGPASMDSVDPAARAQAAQAGEFAKSLGGDLVNPVRSLANKGMGYGLGQAGMDAFLTGAGGGESLAATQSKYGGLEDIYGQLNEESEQTAGRLTKESDVNAKAWDTFRVGEEKRMAAEKAAADQARTAKRRSLSILRGEGKREDWTAYNENDRLLNTLRSVGQRMDPINNLSEIGGNRGTVSHLTDMADGAINGASKGQVANGMKLNWGGVTGGWLGHIPERMKKALYNSMSAEELHAAERMGEKDLNPFIVQRAYKLKNQAYEAKRVLDTIRSGARTKDGNMAAIAAEYDLTPEDVDEIYELAALNF